MHGSLLVSHVNVMYVKYSQVLTFDDHMSGMNIAKKTATGYDATN